MEEMDRMEVENDNYVTPERLMIRQVRKERKKIRKEWKIQEENNHRAFRALQRLQEERDARDRGINIISKEFADQISHPNTSTYIQEPQAWEYLPNDFPSLGERPQPIPSSNTVQLCSYPYPYQPSNNGCQASNNCYEPSKTCYQPAICEPTTSRGKKVNFGPVTVNILDAIANPPIPRQEKMPKVIDYRKYMGNHLDSSQPVRQRGKKREFPKPRTPSRYKELLKQNPKMASWTICKIESYCDHNVTHTINHYADLFLKQVVRFQQNLFKRDPRKARAHRRYVAGFHEVNKYILLKKVKVLIIAPNINTSQPGALENEVQDTIALAKISEIPFLFALSRKRLGKVMWKQVPISIVAILNHDGAQEEYKKLMEEVQLEKDMYVPLPQKVEEEEFTNEIMDNFLNCV